MSLSFAAITPHPPIIIPEIGGEETKKVQKTIKAMEKLAQDLAKTEPDTIIIISPHGLIYPDRMNICGMPKLAGDFSQFGAPQITQKFENNLELAQKIDQKAQKEGIETLLYDNGEEAYILDHGVMVPMYFLAQEIGTVKVLPIAYSYQSRQLHFAFGQVISDVLKKENTKIALIASGDLSHRLIPSAPAGYSFQGKNFDEKIVQLLKNNQVQKILELSEDFVEEAGECGYHSILILLGALYNRKYRPQILSYEGPFGVGYLVAEFLSLE